MLSISLRLRSRYHLSLLGSRQLSISSPRCSIAKSYHDHFKLHQERPKYQALRSGAQPTSRHHVEEEKADDLVFDLIKDEKARRDPQTWNKVLRQMKTLKREDGVNAVWRAFAQYPIDEVPVLYELDLWNNLSGHKLVDYIRKLHDAGIKPPTGTLEKIGLEYHSLSLLQPTDEELIQAALEHVDVKLPENMYNVIMPKLCKKGDYKKAIAWHRKLVAKGDRPRSIEDGKALRQLLLDHRQWAAALEVKTDIASHTVVIQPVRDDLIDSSAAPSRAENDRSLALQSFVSKLDERVGVSHFTSSMDDHTCARFFATKFFSVEFVMEGLSLFGTAQIGSLAVREIVKRSNRGQHCDSGMVRQYFAKMKSLGMTCKTKYGRLLEHFANQDKDVLIHSIVTSDVHPDLYENLEYQEKMLKSSDHLIIERTREVLLFETNDCGLEVRNILLRAGLEDVEGMIADGVPITESSRIAMVENVYIDKAPWISETRLRALVRIFARLPNVTVSEWRHILRTFLYLHRPHLRKDLEALLLSMKDPEIFDFRITAGIIRWYSRVGSLGPTTHMDTMLGGIKVLAVLRDLGLVTDIHRACEANLVSLFGKTPISERIDMKRRAKAQSIGDFEDFVIAIRKLYDPKMWPGMTPAEVKQSVFGIALERQLMNVGSYQGSGQRPIAPHTGSYNPGKIWYMQKRIKEDEAAGRESLTDLERTDSLRPKI